MAKLGALYVGFWGKFLNLCSKAQLPISPNSYPFKLVALNKSSTEISLKEPIHLILWPWRNLSTERIHILVHGKETVDSKTLRVTHSWIKVNYFEPVGKTLKPLESIHYDYKPPEAGHPLFHAQICGDLIDPGVRDASDTFKKLAFQADRIQNRLGTIKIPTAHISFASVLIGLVADHGSPATFAELVALIKNDGALPKACEKGLHDRIKDDGNAFRSFAWYS